MINQTFLNRITHNPNIMLGKPVIRGTRVPVDLLVRLVAQGIPPANILADYPRLQAEDIRYYADHQAEINRYIEANHVPEHLVHPALRSKVLAA